MRYLTTSEKQTFLLGEKFARELKGGEVIGLIGNLGAGKTVFVKGMASSMEIKNKITSPTFVLMKIYKIPKSNLQNPISRLVHIDAYRLKSGKEILSTGAEEYFNKPDSIVIIEWADKIKEVLPKKTKFVKITSNNKNKRKIIIN
jgi:tRNA threonylcarbamoyladenosine biosynthesis protein TsaE